MIEPEATKLKAIKPNSPASTVIISLTDEGKALARKIISLGAKELCSFSHLHKPKPFAEAVVTAFNAGSRLIFICSTGIAIRTLAPILKDKYSDPAVLVLDQKGEHVIPLLSGHEGGANEWARQVATLINATPVITSAENYTHPVYTVGIGCDRGCPLEDIQQLVSSSIKQLENKHTAVTLKVMQSIASIDLKSNETDLLRFCDNLQLPLTTFSAENLRRVEEQLSYKSEIVFKEVGCYGVAEAAALLSATAITGNPAELLLPKQKSKRATCAIALSYR